MQTYSESTKQTGLKRSRSVFQGSAGNKEERRFRSESFFLSCLVNCGGELSAALCRPLLDKKQNDRFNLKVNSSESSA